ncbi:Hypothetical protein LDBND_0859 [Lactobacillus delbrueckii subsp. bulgaricus ND02]|jgi:hypothetical protein|nr:Hypothetical protein LDBND_0859 [Lactobacillus delbrueckii subsp. bulgaricus ND02]
MVSFGQAKSSPARGNQAHDDDNQEDLLALNMFYLPLRGFLGKKSAKVN